MPLPTSRAGLTLLKLSTNVRTRNRCPQPKVGAVYIPPSNENPPLLAGGGADLFDVVVHMHGLEPFEVEYAGAKKIRLGRVTVPVLPLSRIIVGKEATGRPKDLAILPTLKDALLTLKQR